MIRRMNELWHGKRYDDMAELLAEDVVIAPPGSDMRIRGRDAYIQSYRDYDAAATTHEFESGEPEIDVTGDVAVAVCPFTVAYELKGAKYRETGAETLVLSRSAAGWRVAWRTMQTEPA